MLLLANNCEKFSIKQHPLAKIIPDLPRPLRRIDPLLF